MNFFKVSVFDFAGLDGLRFMALTKASFAYIIWNERSTGRMLL